MGLLGRCVKYALYFFTDPGVPGACKIGKDENRPSRYKQARCHSPRGIIVSAVFGFAGKAELTAAERAAHRLLPFHRRPGDVKEWFDLPAAAAIDKLIAAGILDPRNAGPASVPPLPASARLYDDWRDHRPAVAGFRWQLWLFAEASPERRLKLTYGALHDTAFRYAFTYNPWPVRLKGNSFVESIGWAHFPDPNAADLAFDLLLAVDIGVTLDGRIGRLAAKPIPVKPVIDFYLVPGPVVRNWVAEGRRVNRRGAHIYLYKYPLKPGSKEETGQIPELACWRGRFDVLDSLLFAGRSGPVDDFVENS